MFKKRRAFREFIPRLMMSTLAFLFSASAWAGTYALVTGAHEEVCEAYKRNFEPRHDSEPMACERRFDPDVLGFSSVQWTRLNLSDHFDLYKKTQVYLLRNNNSSQGMKLSDADIIKATENLRASAATWHVQLNLARLDLAGDGQLLNVLMVQRGGCGPDAKPTDAATISDLFFLNDSLTGIDYARQDNMNGWFEHATIESYKGRPYIEVYVPDGGWLHLLTGSGILHVLQYVQAAQIAVKFPQAEVRGDGPIAECELKYSQGSTEIR
jgi:hypothetical protein